MAFRSLASVRFWQLYSELPLEVQRLADKQYELFRKDPFHPSLRLKQIGEVWTVRIGQSHPAIGYREEDVFHGQRQSLKPTALAQAAAPQFAVRTDAETAFTPILKAALATTQRLTRQDGVYRNLRVRSSKDVSRFSRVEACRFM